MMEETTPSGYIFPKTTLIEYCKELVDLAAIKTKERIFPVFGFREPSEEEIPLREKENCIQSLGYHEFAFSTVQPPGFEALIKATFQENMPVYFLLPVNRIPRKIKKRMRKADPGRVFTRSYYLKGYIDSIRPEGGELTNEYTITFNPPTIE